MGFSVFTSMTVSAMQTDTGVRMPVTSSPRSSSMLCCAVVACVPMLTASDLKLHQCASTRLHNPSRAFESREHGHPVKAVCVCVFQHHRPSNGSQHPSHVCGGPAQHQLFNVSNCNLAYWLVHDSRRQRMHHVPSKTERSMFLAEETLHNLLTVVTTHYMSDIMH